MMLRRKKRAQGSLEFVSIASFMFIIFIATFMTIEGRMSGIYKDRLYRTMDELSRVVTAEIRMADFAPGDYTREFFLPYTVGNYNYSINITGESEITIRSEGLDYVVFLDQNVSGDIGKGENLITKIDGVINITSLCLSGYGSDDEDCGIIDCSEYYASYYNETTHIFSCFNKTDIEDHRCEDIGKCKESDMNWCSYEENNDVPVYICNECQGINPGGCSGTNIGHCQNVGQGTPCGHGAGHYCDNSGNCM